MKPCCVDNCSECDPVPFRWGLEEERRVPSSSEVFWRLHDSHGSRGSRVSHLSFFVPGAGATIPCQYPLSLKDTSQRTHHSVCCYSALWLYVFFNFMTFVYMTFIFCFKLFSLFFFYRIVSIGGCIFSAVHMIRRIKHSMKASMSSNVYFFPCLSCLSLFSWLFIFRLSGKDPQHSKSARLGKAGP